MISFVNHVLSCCHPSTLLDDKCLMLAFVCIHICVWFCTRLCICICICICIYLMLDAFHHSILLMQDAGNGIGLTGIRESGVLSNFHMQPVYLLPWPLLFATSFKPDEISNKPENTPGLSFPILIKNIRSAPLKKDIYLLKGDHACPFKYNNKEHQAWVLHEPSGLPGQRGTLPSQVRGSQGTQLNPLALGSK